MDQQQPDTKPVNVKGVDPDSWKRAKIAAEMSGETLGARVSRALDQLNDVERRTHLIVPGKPEREPAIPAMHHFPEPEEMVRGDTGSAAERRELCEMLAMLAGAGVPLQPRVVRLLNALLYQQLRPLVPRQVRRGRGGMPGSAAPLIELGKPEDGSD